MSVTITKEKRLELFRRAFVERFGEGFVHGTADEFHEYKESHCGLWVSGEGRMPVNKKGDTAFNYYAMGDDYEFGVHREMEGFLRKHGARAEWYDAGTMMLYLEDDG